MKQKKTPCICVICGKHFLGQNTKSKFCSQRCVYDDQNAKRRKNNIYINTCQICGKQFETKIVNENTCSPECKKARKLKQDKESYFHNLDKRKAKAKEYRESHKQQIAESRSANKIHNYSVAKIWRQDICFCYCRVSEKELVENYAEAKADNFTGWDRHHRLETHNSDGQKRLVSLSVAELKALDMYYNRPAEELIWLRKSEHKKLHQSIKAGANNDGK